MKSLIIAAAVAALALPAFAAESDKEAAQPQVEKTAPAKEKEQAVQKAEKEKFATEGVTKEMARVQAATKPAAPPARAEEAHPTLRFQDWVHDEDNEHGY
jgi:hypothetical protein